MTEPGVDLSTFRPILEAVVPDLAARQERYAVGTDYLDEEIFRAFLDHLGRLVREAGTAVARADLDAVRGIGHSLKGMGGSCGAPEISAAGEALEMIARAGDAGRCTSLIEALDRWRGAASVRKTAEGE